MIKEKYLIKFYKKNCCTLEGLQQFKNISIEQKTYYSILIIFLVTEFEPLSTLYSITPLVSKSSDVTLI